MSCGRIEELRFALDFGRRRWRCVVERQWFGLEEFIQNRYFKHSRNRGRRPDDGGGGHDNRYQLGIPRLTRAITGVGIRYWCVVVMRTKTVAATLGELGELAAA